MCILGSVYTKCTRLLFLTAPGLYCGILTTPSFLCLRTFRLLYACSGLKTLKQGYASSVVC